MHSLFACSVSLLECQVKMNVRLVALANNRIRDDLVQWNNGRIVKYRMKVYSVDCGESTRETRKDLK